MICGSFTSRNREFIHPSLPLIRNMAFGSRLQAIACPAADPCRRRSIPTGKISF
jgi:hypothetical protein